MPRNGSGSYGLPAGNPVVPSTVISSTWANTTLSDIGTALTQSIANDGQTTPVANLPMATFRHTNVGNAVSRTDYAAAGQVQDSSLQWLTSVAGTNTITASITPSLTAYVAGQTFRFVSAGANTGAVTLNINGLGAKAVTKRGTSALTGSEIAASQVVEVVYDGTQFQLMPSAGSGALINVVSFSSGSGTYTPTAGTNSVIVHLLGGGGGAGGCVAQTSNGGNASQGGSGGGYVVHRYTSGFSGLSYSVGAAGTGGANSGANGGNGGDTTFGALTAGGGIGGAGISTANGTSTWSNANATPGGGAGGGNLINRGGDRSFQGGYGATNHALFPNGANGPFGAGGTANLNADGGASTGFGSGGGGIINTTSSAIARTGGAGSGGFILIYEYS